MATSSARKMSQLPAPASRLWEASIRKLQTIRRVGTVAPAPGTVDAATPCLLSVSSSASNTIYQYHEDGEESDTSNEGGNDDDSDAGDDDGAALGEIGRASCRERVSLNV